MPTESKSKDNTREPECFFCGGKLERVHDHFSMQDSERKMEPTILCTHDRCSAAAAQLLELATKYLDNYLKPQERKGPSYFG